MSKKSNHIYQKKLHQAKFVDWCSSYRNKLYNDYIARL